MKYIIHTLAFIVISGFLSAQDVEKPKKPKKLLKNAEKFMNAGELVPDDIILSMMKERIQDDDCNSEC